MLVLSKAAKVTALNSPMDSVYEMVASFKKRHVYLIPALDPINGVKRVSCDGAIAPPQMFQAQSKGSRTLPMRELWLSQFSTKWIWPLCLAQPQARQDLYELRTPQA